MQSRFSAALAAAVALTLAVSYGSAFAAKGQVSIGGNFGVGMYSNKQLNDSLLVPNGIKKVTSGWEYGGSIRYGLSPKLAIELEGNLLNGKSKTTVPAGDFTVKTKAFALPVNLLIGLSENEKYGFNLVVGAGPLLSTKIETKDETVNPAVTDESAKKTTFMAQGGFEGDVFLSRNFALTGRVLGRYAKAKNVDLNPSDPSDGNIDINLSGFAFGLGLRAFFGGSQ